METSVLVDPSLLYVHVSAWEYQCCGEVPRVGATLRGTLTLHPSRRPGYPAPRVRDWNPDSGLVLVDDVYAQLGFSVTDPYRTDLVVSLGWHDAGPAPVISGVVGMLLEETGVYVRERSGELDLDPGTVEYRAVAEATRWPEDRREPGGAALAGVVVGLAVADVRAEGLRLFADSVIH